MNDEKIRNERVDAWADTKAMEVGWESETVGRNAKRRAETKLKPDRVENSRYMLAGRVQ